MSCTAVPLLSVFNWRSAHNQSYWDWEVLMIVETTLFDSIKTFYFWSSMQSVSRTRWATHIHSQSM